MGCGMGEEEKGGMGVSVCLLDSAAYLHLGTV